METKLHRLLSDGYERPKKTYTDTIQNNEEIEKKLEGFEEVDEDDIDNIAINSYLRYVKFDTKTHNERLVTGGILLRIYPEYLLLKGKNDGTFCAQRYTRKNSKGKVIHTTRFFKQLSKEDKLKSDLIYMQEKATKIIQGYEDTVNKQREEIEALKKMLRKKVKN